jgi:hypothetical protein
MSMAGKLEQRESECEALRRAVSRLQLAATEVGDETPNAATVAAQEEAAHALHALQLQCDEMAMEVRRRRRYTHHCPSLLGLLIGEPAAKCPGPYVQLLKAQQAATVAREEAAAHASRANLAESTVATLQESVEKGCALHSAHE